MWSRQDSGRGLNWRQALEYAESKALAGYSDWRLPNAKELQYIVDYRRSPDTNGTAVIDPLFDATPIVNEAGDRDYPAYWSSTTHLDGPRPATKAVYIAFGRAIGEMDGRIMDVHGAGSQRSDPKLGTAALGHGPQGDAVRVKNFVRVVRGAALLNRTPEQTTDYDAYPYKVVLNDREKSVIDSDSGRPPSSDNRPEQNEPLSPANFVGHFIERLDKNGDGQVSRHEFDGPKDRFGFHDQDGDGYLTEKELQINPPPHPSFGAPPGRIRRQ
jgi:hypothetical protein